MPQTSRTGKQSSSPVARRPSTVTVPEVGISSALSSFANVDFPLPLRPSTARNSPAGTSSVTPLTAGNPNLHIDNARLARG